ncbi:unnamed protein product [Oikopleura dioica]|uniref:Uncharacterized protein n=1 Tax=Oikopleura dioica TaxID=34765 RepID=E4WUX7_OIKDI|nr:unnamed protein product [Oikopleura dioica]
MARYGRKSAVTEASSSEEDVSEDVSSDESSESIEDRKISKKMDDHKERHPSLQDFLNQKPKIYQRVDRNDAEARVAQNSEMLYDALKDYSTFLHHNLPLKRRIRTGIDEIDRGTKDVVRLAERAQRRQGEIDDMLANVKQNILLMRETKINTLKFPKMNEEVDLLFKWNKEIIPKIRDDLPEVMKECQEQVDKEHKELLERIDSLHQEHLAALKKLEEKIVAKLEEEMLEVKPCCSIM